LDSAHVAPETALGFAQELIGFIAERDISALARRVDPSRSLTFSPYPYIDLGTVVTLDREALVEAWSQNQTFVWGRYDGTGEPIELQIRRYFEEFVYDRDFRTKPPTSADLVPSRGNTRENLQEVFPGTIAVEFHVQGSDPRFDGLDWASLLCVLSPRPDGGWWLVALVHNQWTI
jgi:hypothetical protein